MDRLKILLLILDEFKRIKHYSSYNHQNIIEFRGKSKSKFGDDLLSKDKK